MTEVLPCLARFVNETLVPLHGLNTPVSATGATNAPTTVPAQTIVDLRSALAHMRADDRELWIRIGIALYELGDVGRGLWMVWSQSSEKFAALDAARTWDSFKPTNTGYRVVFAEAKRRGWVNVGTHQYSDIPVPSFILHRDFTVGGEPWSEITSRPFGAETKIVETISSPIYRRYQLINGAALASLPPTVWLIRGVLPATGIYSTYGASGSGKTFLVLGLAVALAGGSRWFGYRVKHATVIYVGLEGEGGFKARVEALVKANQQPFPPNIYFLLRQQFSLTVPKDVQDLAIAARDCEGRLVIIIDTLNRAAPEIDENSSLGMGSVLSGAKELQQLVGGLVILVHHSGKDAQRGPRGHSSLLAAMDGTIEVTRDANGRNWHVAKSKDGEEGASHPFRLDVVSLGEDEDREPITSCVVTPTIQSAVHDKANTPSGANQKIAWDVIRFLLTGGLTGVPGAPLDSRCIEHGAAVAAIGPRLTCEPERRCERAKAAIDGLITRGLLGHWSGHLWRA